jgi:hypothetical protein
MSFSFLGVGVLAVTSLAQPSRGLLGVVLSAVEEVLVDWPRGESA